MAPLKGLVNVLEGLIGDSVTIELKNGFVVTGTLVNIDMTMTAHLSGAKIARPKGEPELHDEYTVRGTHIRAFELSEATDIDTLLRKAEAAEKKKTLSAGGVGGAKGAGKPKPKKEAGTRRERE